MRELGFVAAVVAITYLLVFIGKVTDRSRESGAQPRSPQPHSGTFHNPGGDLPAGRNDAGEGRRRSAGGGGKSARRRGRDSGRGEYGGGSGGDYGSSIGFSGSDGGSGDGGGDGGGGGW
jgi:hypothetical protein